MIAQMNYFQPDFTKSAVGLGNHSSDQLSSGMNDSDFAAKTIDSFSFKLNQLSLEERSHALHDLHGVSDQTKETPHMIQKKTREMTEALEKISASAAANNIESDSCWAYLKAIEMSPEYVDGLKLRFLRGQLYDGQAAAARMIRFFHQKMDLFGQAKLVHDLTLQDLSEEERQLLKKGLVQLLPHRDQSGRPIMLLHGKLNGSCLNTKSVMRIVCCFGTAAFQNDVDSQLNGIVAVYYGLCQERIVPGRTNEYVKLITSFPDRIVAWHYCKDSSGVLDSAINFWWKVLESRLLCRVRFHTGTHIECVYNMMTFGIPREAIPISDDGSLVLSDHHRLLQSLECRQQQHLEEDALKPPSPIPSKALLSDTTSRLQPSHAKQAQRKTKEEGALKSANMQSPSILIPGPLDVLMGRGRHPKTCTGALRLQNLLLKYRDPYEAASRNDKAKVADLIRNEMKVSGCRFLIFVSPQGFLEADDAAIREKISHAFRNLRMKAKNESNKKRLSDNTLTPFVGGDSSSKVPQQISSSSKVRKQHHFI